MSDMNVNTYKEEYEMQEVKIRLYCECGEEMDWQVGEPVAETHKCPECGGISIEEKIYPFIYYNEIPLNE